jgi:hypothetical protein
VVIVYGDTGGPAVTDVETNPVHVGIISFVSFVLHRDDTMSVWTSRDSVKPSKISTTVRATNQSIKPKSLPR